jgi:hypothetical protein
MRTCNRLGQLIEQWLLNLGKLGGIHDFEDVLYLVQEHDLLCTVDLGPVPKEAKYHLSEELDVCSYIGFVNVYYLFRQCRIFLEELHNTIRKLRMVHAQTLGLVHWNKHSGEEEFVLFLQR